MSAVTAAKLRGSYRLRTQTGDVMQVDQIEARIMALEFVVEVILANHLLDVTNSDELLEAIAAAPAAPTRPGQLVDAELLLAQGQAVAAHTEDICRKIAVRMNHLRVAQE